MAYTVSRRTREIGLRMALGAARWEVIRMVMQEVGLLALVGLGIALPAAYALSRLVREQLYSVTGSDPAVFAAASLLRATPPARRSEFASEIWAKRRERGQIEVIRSRSKRFRYFPQSASIV
jgi:ABC-type antimicrobial peptide transport system permease subunit